MRTFREEIEMIIENDTTDYPDGTVSNASEVADAILEVFEEELNKFKREIPLYELRDADGNKRDNTNSVCIVVNCNRFIDNIKKIVRR